MATDWDAFRARMPILNKWAYFDHAAVSPLSSDSRDEITKWMTQAVEEGDTVWPEWNARVERLRATGARIIAADPDEVAIIPNTTTGLGIVAEGLGWREGDNLVTLNDEFPSNLYPWLNLRSRGVETRMVDPQGQDRISSLLDACDSRTRLITVSWVSYITGWRTGLAELVEKAHARRILVMVDAIQGMGVFPLNVRSIPIDFLAADGHKWMMGPEGVGFLYVAKENLDLLRPVGVGWNSVSHRYDYQKIELRLRNEAARYEGGSQNMAGIAGLDASTRLLEEFGHGPDASAIGERILQVTDHAIERIRSMDAELLTTGEPDNRSGIVSFRTRDEDPRVVRKRCLAAGVVISCRNGWLRMSPHAYNNESDVDRMIDAIQAGR